MCGIGEEFYSSVAIEERRRLSAGILYYVSIYYINMW